MVRRPSLPSLLAAVALAAACADEAAVAPIEVREPIAIRYVAESELPIRAAKDPSSEVLATFAVGESVSVLADEGEWSEVRLNLDLSGWVPSASISDQPPPSGDVRAEGGRPVAQFRVAPSPVFTPTGASGEIVLEASVNTRGDVVGVRVLGNTTGRKDLEIKNVEELRKAKFYPMVRGGTRQPFLYEHRVSY